MDNSVELAHILEVKTLLRANNAKLIKSSISPQDYYVNLSFKAPDLSYPKAGISRTVVNLCELISTLLLEDIDDSKSIGKVIVMMFEYYFLVSPIIFKDQGAILVNDHVFMKTFLRYIQSLCKGRAQVQKELGNLLVSLDLYKPANESMAFWLNQLNEPE